MIQFNLLPDVKLEFVKAQRVKHTVVSAAIITTGSAFAIFILLFLAVNVAQRKQINDLGTEIKTLSKELKETPDLDKILTIQNQLSKLTDLHAAKPAAARSFTYIQQLVPPNVSLNEFNVDFDTKAISISGNAAQLTDVNKLVDTLKFTQLNSAETGTDGEQAASGRAFSNVVLAQFTRSEDAASFTVTATYKEDIFDNKASTGLKVPNQVSSPSVVGQPTNLFKKVEQP
jgi:hypothetical protein